MLLRCFKSSSNVKTEPWSFGFCGAAMLLSNFAAERKLHTAAFIMVFGMMTVKGREDPLTVSIIKPDAIILNTDLHPIPLLVFYDTAGDSHTGRYLCFGKFQGILDQVIEKLVN